MTNFMDLLQGQLSDQVIDQLSHQLGGADRNKTAMAANGIFSFLTNALSKNAASKEGASALSMALDRDHDGSVLDDILGMVSGATNPRNARALNGAGILSHVLGGRQNNVIEMIARMSGLDKNNTANLMIKLAPMVLGVLGRAKRQNHMNESGLSDFLFRSAEQHNQQHQQTDLITRVLDRDGDGSMMDEIADFGLKALGNLFKK